MINDEYGDFLTIEEVGNVLDISTQRVMGLVRTGRLIPFDKGENGEYIFEKTYLSLIDDFNRIFNTDWDDFVSITPKKPFTSIELFAGCGGLSLGLEKSGFNPLMLNELDKWGCETLRKNRPEWNVVEGDISKIDFTEYCGKVDLVSGGFPCQAFSYAGKKLGFEDTRGTLFFEFARCIKEVQPKVFIGENVKGLFNHEKGRTLQIIKEVIKDLGYTLVSSKVLKSMYFKVPQKRERLFLIGIRNDLLNQNVQYQLPSPYKKVLTVSDAIYKGVLYDNNVPISEGDKYPIRKKEIMDLVPQGGFWKDLPLDIQKEYMGGSFYLGGGKTGLARRLSLNHPSLTLVCSPSMKQTERCHPTETRPLTVRESGRIQTFPDDWFFCGPKVQQYKQIGNAVPVNLGWVVGLSVVRLLNQLD